MKKRGSNKEFGSTKESEHALLKKRTSQEVKDDFFTAAKDSLSDGIAEEENGSKNDDISNDFFLSGFSPDDELV